MLESLDEKNDLDRGGCEASFMDVGQMLSCVRTSAHPRSLIPMPLSSASETGDLQSDADHLASVFGRG